MAGSISSWMCLLYMGIKSSLVLVNSGKFKPGLRSSSQAKVFKLSVGQLGSVCKHIRKNFGLLMLIKEEILEAGTGCLPSSLELSPHPSWILRPYASQILLFCLPLCWFLAFPCPLGSCMCQLSFSVCFLSSTFLSFELRTLNQTHHIPVHGTFSSRIQTWLSYISIQLFTQLF